MKKILVKEAVLSPGMEFQANSYPGDGLYWLESRSQLAVVARGSCILVIVDRSLIIEDVDVVGVGGGPSESFVLTLMDKTAELMKYQATRAVRNTDTDSAM